MDYLKSEEEMFNFVSNLPKNIRYTKLFLSCKEKTANVFSNFCSKYEDVILKNVVTFKSDIPIDNVFNLMILIHSLQFFNTNFAKQNKEKIEHFIIDNFSKIDPEIFYYNDSYFLLEDLIECSKKHPFIYEFLNKHLEFIAIILTNKKLTVLKKEKILNTYTELIKDVFRIENANICDLVLKRGVFSNVLIIKDKVIKSGKKVTKNIPYHKRLLQPIIRQVITSINDNNVALDFIEPNGIRYFFYL